ncbi:MULTISPECIES: winged helix-turn-helix transcriptional regulator [Anaerotignum]|uniref:winged helix-turn-helix transcriptional regulator n=1 Tax=Anaerotignum TaxID=2039240 RepID=UPI00210918EA|nr:MULTISPECIES: helix-turn-helix domain-containing protein [Anaerotignum]MCQ4935762.1 helix-turn-helix transcriptional regulator [Anaerotignum propionicum]
MKDMIIFMGDNNVFCPVTYSLSLIGGKWKLPIIWVLSQCGTLRFNELKKKIVGITNMMLTSSLKELEQDGLIERVQYNVMPSHVEYSLAEAGRKLLPALDELAKWGAEVAQDKMD